MSQVAVVLQSACDRGRENFFLPPTSGRIGCAYLLPTWWQDWLWYGETPSETAIRFRTFTKKTSLHQILTKTLLRVWCVFVVMCVFKTVKYEMFPCKKLTQTIPVRFRTISHQYDHTMSKYLFFDLRSIK